VACVCVLNSLGICTGQEVKSNSCSSTGTVIREPALSVVQSKHPTVLLVLSGFEKSCIGVQGFTMGCVVAPLHMLLSSGTLHAGDAGLHTRFDTLHVGCKCIYAVRACRTDVTQKAVSTGAYSAASWK
jgi:hypothetical protein